MCKLANIWRSLLNALVSVGISRPGWGGGGWWASGARANGSISDVHIWGAGLFVIRTLWCASSNSTFYHPIIWRAGLLFRRASPLCQRKLPRARAIISRLDFS